MALSSSPRRGRATIAEPAATKLSLEYELHFRKSGETKGTIKYMELDGPDGDQQELSTMVIGMVYIRKSSLNGKAAPEKLVITVKG